MANILTIAADEAFVTLLKDGLEDLGLHRVLTASSEMEIERVMSGHRIDLVIVDVDLEDLEPVALVQDMRRTNPALRVMWMPFLGYELSEEMQAVETQGILTKPFFMGDLPDQIEAALSVKVPELTSDDSSRTPVPETASRAPASETLRGSDVIWRSEPKMTGPTPEPLADVSAPVLPDKQSIRDNLNRLALELDADAVIIFNRKGDLLARAGHMPPRRAAELADILKSELAATNDAATFLKEKSGHFANSIHEGESFRLFSSVLLSAGLALAVVTRLEMPLGTVRYHVRQAVTQLTADIQGTG